MSNKKMKGKISFEEESKFPNSYPGSNIVGVMENF